MIDPKEQTAYAYKFDRAVPDFDDSKPLFVFDNICVLCSGGTAFLMKCDRRQSINFTSAQGELGQALYAHFGLALDDSYLFIVEGRGYTMSDGYFALARSLGGLWKFAFVFRLVPRPLREAVYRMIASNRYSLFGKTEACALLSDEQRARLI